MQTDQSTGTIDRAATTSHSQPLNPPTGPTTASMFVRYVTHILDDLSAQGLRLWLDECGRWNWYWAGTELGSERGFWALGEALLDALATRFPAVFVSPAEQEAGAVAE